MQKQSLLASYALTPRQQVQRQLEEANKLSNVEIIQQLAEIKNKELEDCMNRCNELRGELSELNNTCPTDMTRCDWTENVNTSGQVVKMCSKCSKLIFEVKGGNRRKSKRKKSKRRKSKRKKSKRRKSKKTINYIN